MRWFKVAAWAHAIIVLSVLFPLGAGAFLLQQISNLNGEHSATLTTQVRQQDQARAIQVHFQKQVQAWQNVLIRGHDPRDLQEDTAELFAEEANVVRLTKQLSRDAGGPRTKAKLEAFLHAHQRAGLAYRKGLALARETTRTSPEWHERIEREVRGVEQPPAELLGSVLAALGDEISELQAVQQDRVARQTRNLAPFVVAYYLGLAVFAALLGKRITPRQGTAPE